ncbi:MAG: hypothetical protein NTW21_31005 [Verrucomicrobia bacterium]|nr:hypothetical protein [Verrucomicrobiota bacterium]
MKARPTKSASHLVSVFVFVIAAAFGWYFTGGPAAPGESTPDTSSKTCATGRSNRNKSSDAPAWLAGTLDQIRKADSFAERMRLTLAFAPSIPNHDIFVWLKGGWFNPGDGYETRLFTRVLTDRLEAADPVALARLQLAAENPSTDQLIALAASDPQQVIELFREQPNDMLELRILKEMARVHPAIALERFLELSACGFPEGESYGYEDVIAALAKADPTALQAALGKMPSYLRYDAERDLLSIRLSESFDTEIRRLWQRPDGWYLFSHNANNIEIETRLFNQLADLPPSWRNALAAQGGGGSHLAESWWNADLEAVGFTAAQALRIRKRALESITRESPAKGLTLLDDVELNPAERKDLIQGVFARASLNDDQAAKLLDLLTDDDWQAAQEQLARKRGVTFVPIPQVDKPDQWLADFANLEPRSDDNRQYRNMLHKWDKDQLEALTRQFQSLPDDQKTKISEKLVVEQSGVPLGFRGDAIRYLAATPEQHPEIIGTATSYALERLRNDPVAAGDWVRGLPAGEAREWAQKNLAVQWSATDPAAAERWLKSLPKKEQAPVREFMNKSAQDRETGP